MLKTSNIFFSPSKFLGVTLLHIFSFAVIKGYSQTSNIKFELVGTNKHSKRNIKDTLFLITLDKDITIKPLHTGRISRNSISFLNHKYLYFNVFNTLEEFYIRLIDLHKINLQNESISIIQNLLINNDSIVAIDSTDLEFQTEIESGKLERNMYLFDVKSRKKLMSLRINDNKFFNTTNFSERNIKDNIAYSYIDLGKNGKKYSHLMLINLENKNIIQLDSLIVCDMVFKDCDWFLTKSLIFNESKNLNYIVIEKSKSKFNLIVYDYDPRKRVKSILKKFKFEFFSTNFITAVYYKNQCYVLTEDKLILVDNQNKVRILYETNKYKLKDFSIIGK